MGGTVLDSSGAVLPGATITLTSEQTAQVQTTTSSETGAFLFPQVPVGTYKVEIELQGFKTATFTKVSVAVAQEYSLTARLELGNVSENVTVEAGASLVPTTSPEVTATVLQRQVLDIPLANRDVTNLIKLQAGVRHRQPDQHRHQRRPADLDAGDARRHQHPGQLHPHELARLRAEPADLRQRRASSRSRRRCGADAAGGATRCG